MLKSKKLFFFLYFLVIFTVNIVVLVCLKIMKLGKAMALGTHFVDSKHDQNVDVSKDIIMIGRLPLTIRLKELSAFQHIFVCSVIKSNSITSNSDAGKKDQNSLSALY